MSNKKRINWKLASSRIPSGIVIGGKRWEVLYVDDFGERKIIGETRWPDRQIILKKDKNYKELTHTFFHEMIHAVSFELELSLTEKNVIGLEKAFSNFIDVHHQLFGDAKNVNT